MMISMWHSIHHVKLQQTTSVLNKSLMSKNTDREIQFRVKRVQHCENGARGGRAQREHGSQNYYTNIYA